MAREAGPVDRRRRDARRRDDRQGRRRGAGARLGRRDGAARGGGRDDRRRRGAGRDRSGGRPSRGGAAGCRRRAREPSVAAAGSALRLEDRARRRSLRRTAPAAPPRTAPSGSPSASISISRDPRDRPRRPDPARRRRTSPRPRRTRSAANGAGAGRAAAPAVPPIGANVTPLKGPAATLAGYMEQSLTIPTATSFRTIGVGTLEARRAELNAALKARRPQREGLVHAPDRLSRSSARRTSMPAIDRDFRRENGTPQRVESGHQPRPRRRRAAQGRLALPRRSGHQERRRARLRAVPRRLRRARRESARRTSSTADELTGATFTLTNPGGIGTVASVPRLMAGQGAIIAAGAIGYPPGFAHATEAALAQLGIEKVMTLTSTYDHRVIQGAQSGEYLRRVEQLLGGDDGFYEGVFARSASSPAATGARRRDVRAPRARSRRGEITGVAVGRAAARGRGRDRRSSRRTAGTATSPRTSIRSARRRKAIRRSIPRPTTSRPRCMKRDPGVGAARAACPAHARRRAAAPARDVRVDDRLRDRAHLEHASSASGCASTSRAGAHRAPLTPRAQGASPRAAHQGRDDGALLPQALHVAEDVLDRRPRHDDADARRD